MQSHARGMGFFQIFVVEKIKVIMALISGSSHPIYTVHAQNI